MYERMVDVPRLVCSYGIGAELPHPVLTEARDRLSRHYLPELGEPISHYAHAVRFGNLLFVSGCAPVDASLRLVGGDDVVKTVKREEPKIGRNDPCWCGSGKKFKKCHGA